MASEKIVLCLGLCHSSENAVNLMICMSIILNMLKVIADCLHITYHATAARGLGPFQVQPQEVSVLNISWFASFQVQPFLNFC